jgi:hypothetical protein
VTSSAFGHEAASIKPAKTGFAVIGGGDGDDAQPSSVKSSGKVNQRVATMALLPETIRE